MYFLSLLPILKYLLSKPREKIFMANTKIRENWKIISRDIGNRSSHNGVKVLNK